MSDSMVKERVGGGGRRRRRSKGGGMGDDWTVHKPDIESKTTSHKNTQRTTRLTRTRRARGAHKIDSGYDRGVKCD